MTPDHFNEVNVLYAMSTLHTGSIATNSFENLVFLHETLLLVH